MFLRTARLLASRSYWLHLFSWRRFVTSFFAAAGVLWTVVEATSFFSSSGGEWFRSHLPLFAALALGWSLWSVRPLLRTTCRLRQRDVTIEIVVDDLFATEDALVIGSNRTFVTELGDRLISPRSIQGQFTERYYDSTTHLDTDISSALAGQPFENVQVAGCPARKRYSYGTVARVSPKGRVAYLLAIAELNEHGAAHGSHEGLLQALAGLWQYLSERGDLSPIRMPILGSGFSRLTPQRAQLTRDILRSFVAACAERSFCTKLTIVIAPKDFQDHDIDFRSLSEFLAFLCSYTEFRAPGEAGSGLPLPHAP